MSYLIIKTHKLENVNYFGTVIYHCVCCNKLAKFSESFESIVCYPLKETRICHVNCAECAEGDHGCNNSDCKCFVQERAPEIEKILDQAKDQEQKQQDHEKAELQTQVTLLKAICKLQKKALEQCTCRCNCSLVECGVCPEHGEHHSGTNTECPCGGRK